MTPRGSRREAGRGRVSRLRPPRPCRDTSRDRSSQHAPVLVARWPAVRTCGLEPSITGPSSFGFCGPARRSRTVRRRPRCGVHRLRQAHVPPQRRSHRPPAHRSGDELPQLRNPQAQPGRRELRGDADDPARRPGRDHRQRQPDGRGRVPHRDAAAPPSAPRRLPGAGVRQERKRQRELTDRLRPLTERREQLRLSGPVRPPHRCDHTARLRAGGHQQARQRLRAGVDKPHRGRPPAWVPKLSTTTSPGPRARSFRIWREPATRPWLDVAATALISSAAQLPSRTVA
jgi:hypothetical protein